RYGAARSDVHAGGVPDRFLAIGPIEVGIDQAGVADGYERLAGAEHAGFDGHPLGASARVVEEDVLRVADLVAVPVVHGVIQEDRDLFAGDHLPSPSLRGRSPPVLLISSRKTVQTPQNTLNFPQCSLTVTAPAPRAGEAGSGQARRGRKEHLFRPRPSALPANVRPAPRGGAGRDPAGAGYRLPALRVARSHSLFMPVMEVSGMPLGQAVAHSPASVHPPKPSSSICATMSRTL